MRHLLIAVNHDTHGTSRYVPSRGGLESKDGVRAREEVVVVMLVEDRPMR